MPRFSADQKKTINQMLLTEGERLFNEKGLNTVTAEEIAYACGIAKGTFYHFYENKEHLYMTINNHIQNSIFSRFRNQFQSTTEQSASRIFYNALVYIMECFLKHPLVMDIRPEIWSQIEAKAPKECINENNARDLELITYLSKTNFRFRYDLATTTQLLQMQFLQLAYIKNETHNIELMKIVLLALATHLIQEDET
ncbi:MAG: TetR/AcrR family transcriptional regulator [Clostridiales bacterium]|nr:TetR/AcrR family transcriptional regulator [Clostridiales bacterium]